MMVRPAIAPMILAASILAVPVLAATQSNDAPNNSPAAAASTPTSNLGTGMTGTRQSQTMTTTGTTASDTSTSATPRYTTADGQMRIGKIVGASVYNEQDQSVGSIDDVLISNGNKANTAVISVGGFLGMGSKLVTIPFDQLKIGNNRIVMPGATKASLNGMPEYKYNNA